MAVSVTHPFTSPFQAFPPLIVDKGYKKDPSISPLYRIYEGLPVLMMLVGGQEILYDTTLRVAEKAKLDINEKMPYVYPVFAGLLHEGKAAIDRIAYFTKSC